MLVGAGVGRWWFTLRALRCPMAEPATEVTFPTKSHSGAKLHRCIIIVRVGCVNRDGNRTFMLVLFVYDMSLCERELICSAICIADYKSMGHYVRTQA